MNSNNEKWWLLFILTIIWGSSFMLIKKGLEHFSPYEVGALRALIAGLVLLPMAIKNIKKFPKHGVKWLILSAITGNFIPMFLFPIAETEISSSIAGIINSMLPIFVIIVGSIMWNFKTTKRQILGVCISFFGVCLLALNGYENGNLRIFPILLLLLASVLYAISVTTVKSKLSNIPAKILSGFVFSFVLLLPSFVALVFSGFFKNFTGNQSDLIGLGYVFLLSVFGTGLAMMLNYRLINISTPLFASTVTLLMPIVAVIWGLLDGERLNSIQVLGSLFILAGLIFLRTKKIKILPE